MAPCGSAPQTRRARRRRLSPNRIRWSRHSSRIDRTNRSAQALAFGAWKGVSTTRPCLSPRLRPVGRPLMSQLRCGDNPDSMITLLFHLLRCPSSAAATVSSPWRTSPGVRHAAGLTSAAGPYSSLPSAPRAPSGPRLVFAYRRKPLKSEQTDHCQRQSVPKPVSVRWRCPRFA
jgi:hypothetical protein